MLTTKCCMITHRIWKQHLCFWSMSISSCSFSMKKNKETPHLSPYTATASLRSLLNAMKPSKSEWASKPKWSAWTTSSRWPSKKTQRSRGRQTPSSISLKKKINSWESCWWYMWRHRSKRVYRKALRISMNKFKNRNSRVITIVSNLK